MRKRLTYPVFLFLAVLLVFFQAAGFGLLGLDDADYTVGNDFVNAGLSWGGVAAAFTHLSRNGIWMPVTNICYMLDFTLAGDGSPVPLLHISSILLHASNAVLLYWLLAALPREAMQNAECRMQNGGALGESALPDGGFAPREYAAFAAFVAAAFWALHPLRAESVAWVASRKDTVMAFFTLLGLIAWRRFSMQNAECRMQNEGAKRPYLLSPISYLLSLICAALAALSKPTGMVFPALAFSVELLVSGLPSLRRLRKYLPLLAIGLATGLVAIHAQHHPEGVVQAAADTTFTWRLLNGAVALGLYLWQTVVPVGLHPVCMPVLDGLPEGALPGLATLTLVVLLSALFLRKSQAAAPLRPSSFVLRPSPPSAPAVLAAAGLWFLAAVAPTLGILAPFGMQSRADRFTYLPAMGLSIALAFGLRAAAKRMRNDCRSADGPSACSEAVDGWTASEGSAHRQGETRPSYFVLRTSAAALAVAALAALAALTLRQTGFFRDDEAFFGRAVRCDPGNAYAWTKLGEKYLYRPGEQGRGVACFRRAWQARPADEYAGLLAYVLAERGDPGDFAEIKTLCAGLAEKPELDAKGHATQALGAVAFAEGRFADAVRYFEAAEKVFPPSTDLSLRLAASHFNAGNLAEAERRFRLVLRAADGPARDFALQSLQKIFLQRQWKSAGGGQ